MFGHLKLKDWVDQPEVGKGRKGEREHFRVRGGGEGAREGSLSLPPPLIGSLSITSLFGLYFLPSPCVLERCSSVLKSPRAKVLKENRFRLPTPLAL